MVDSLIEVNTPVANFSVDTLEGCSPLFVSFTDQSLNAVAWNWNFGNGSYSANQHPSLIYTNPGYYDVQLISENKFGCLDSILIDSLVLVRGAVPLFTVSSVSGCAPHAISLPMYHKIV
ncbi:MAG: PKD domain-containing protein [Bacteroidetes bacterium]|nr:PKD domain-containing protein [Bacteroidota bacterium]